MKIALVTSATELKEVKRIKEEVKAAGHKFKLIDFKKFKYIKKGRVFSFYPVIPDCDIVIVRGLFSTMRSLEPLKDYLGYKAVKVFDNNLFTHKYSMNKAYDILKLIVAGIRVPDTFSARQYPDLYDFGLDATYPLIIKSAKAGQGSRVWMVKSKTQYKNFIKAFERKDYPAKNIIVQAFIDYEYDLRIFVLGKEMYCMRRFPRQGDFRANFSLGGTVELFPLTDELRSLAREAIQAIGLEVAGVDVLIDKKGRKYILEVNHTPGMVGMEEATHENITKKYLDYTIARARMSK